MQEEIFTRPEKENEKDENNKERYEIVMEENMTEISNEEKKEQENRKIS